MNMPRIHACSWSHVTSCIWVYEGEPLLKKRPFSPSIQMFGEMAALFRNNHFRTLVPESKKRRPYRTICAHSSFLCTHFHLFLCVSWLCVCGWDCVSGTSVTLKDRWRRRFTANYFQLNGPWWAGWTTTECLQETSAPDKPAPPSLYGCYTEAAGSIFKYFTVQYFASL